MQYDVLMTKHPMQDLPSERIIENVLLALMENSSTITREFSLAGDSLFGKYGACPSKDAIEKMVYSQDPVVVSNVASSHAIDFTHQTHIMNQATQWYKGNNSNCSIEDADLILRHLSANRAIHKSVRNWLAEEPRLLQALARGSDDSTFLHSLVSPYNIEDDTVFSLYAAISEHDNAYPETLDMLAASTHNSIIQNLIRNKNLAFDTISRLEQRGLAGKLARYFDSFTPKDDPDVIIRLMKNNNQVSNGSSFYVYEPENSNALLQLCVATNTGDKFYEIARTELEETLVLISNLPDVATFKSIKQELSLISEWDVKYSIRERAFLLSIGLMKNSIFASSEAGIDFGLLVHTQV